VQALPLCPVAGAASAHENQVKPVLSGLSKDDCLRVAAPLAADAFTPLKGWVLDAFGINLDVFRTHRKISSVYAVVHLIVLLRALVTIAELAFEL